MPTVVETEEDVTTEEAARSRRSRGEDAVPAPGHSTRNAPQDYRQVNGWGADLDPASRPSYPKELPSDVNTVRGEVKSWQTPRTRIHVSNEHPNLTPVFGESVPPHGLSGRMRDFAYEYGEASNRHWMTLLLADRVGVVEGLLSGLFTGKPDNYVREKGWSAKLKYPNTNTLQQQKQRTLLWAGGAILGAVALGVVLNHVLSDD